MSNDNDWSESKINLKNSKKMKAQINRSEIMKAAWNLVKTAGKTISEGLKAAWAKAKNKAEGMITTMAAKFGVVLPASLYETGTVSSKVWEKDGKVRVYVSVNWTKGRPTDCGYVDLVSGKSYLESNPKGVARSIYSEMQIISK